MMLEYSYKENEMKKILILLLSIVIAFTSCATAKVEAVPEIVAPQPVSVPEVQEEGISGEIIEVSKYGNTYLDVTTDALLEEFALGDIVEISVNGNTIVAPVVTSYSDVDNGSPLVKVDGENVEVALSYADFAGTYGAGVGTGMTLTLFEKEGYLAEYQVRHLERTDVREDYESDEVFANFRALSGGNLKENLIYRSCNPGLGDARAPYADALAEEVGIRKVMNLADSDESLLITIDPNSYYATLYENGDIVLLNMGVDFRTDDFKAKLKSGFEFILSDPVGPVLIHCNEGKDRAGIVSALVEALAGASMDEIVEDYMRSYENYYGVEKGSEQYDAIASIITDFFQTVNGRPFPADSVKTVAENYLINQVGLSAAEVATLESLITE